MRSRIAKRLPPDADKLVGLSLSLFASGSRIEDRFWEARLDTLLAKIVRNGNQTALDAALDHLQQHHPDAYGALADMAETQSESFPIEIEGIPHEALLIAAPVLAWTRYAIPSGPLKPETTDALRTQLQAHVLATGAKVAFLFNKVGLAGCDMGACAILPRIIGQARASELLFTGRFMSAEEGERWGFFSRVVAPSEVLLQAVALANDIAAGPTFANTMTKRMLAMEWAMSVEEAIEAEAIAQALCMTTEDFTRAFEAFANKQKPVFKGN